MSEIEVERCEISKIDKDLLDVKKVLEREKNSDIVALEVLNDIVENALDSALHDEKITKTYRLRGEIVDQYTPRATRITELYDVPTEMENQTRQLTTTEEEVKKLIGDLSTPPAKGTGDQLQENDEIITKKKSPPISSRNFSLEKKTRLTNLVRNSKSVLSKLLTPENLKEKESEWEEGREEFVKSIELNRQVPGKILSPKDRLLMSSTSEDVLKIPDETEMENINLKDSKDITQNRHDDMDCTQKFMTFPRSTCSRIPSSHHESKESTKDKKKWNFGTKLVNFIKKKASRRDMAKTEL